MVKLTCGVAVEHPQMMSPLAKYHRSKKGTCRRNVVFVCLKKVANDADVE